MPENLRDIATHCLPFMVAATQGKPTMNATRMLEAVVIALVTAVLGVAVSWFILIPEIKTEFKYLQRDLGVLSGQMAKIDNEVDTLRTDLAVEKARRETKRALPLSLQPYSGNASTR